MGFRSSSSSFTYDLIGSNTRHGFPGNLYKALSDIITMLSLNYASSETFKLKMVLYQLPNFSVYHFKDCDGYEYEFIVRIAERVCSKINPTCLHVVDYLVGLESPKVMKLLHVGSDGVSMIWIHRVGGIGKTTLALPVYNLIFGNYFDDYGREKSNKHGL